MRPERSTPVDARRVGPGEGLRRGAATASARRHRATRRDRRDADSRQALLQRVAGEYAELPGLRLTLAQVRRLFDLRDDICARVLETLVAFDLLEQDDEGAFVRSRHRM